MSRPSDESANGVHCRFFAGLKCLQDVSRDIPELCLSCERFDNTNDVNVLKQALRDSCEKYRRREQEVEVLNTIYWLHFSEVFVVVDRLCKGDPAARVKVFTDNELIRTLEERLNLLAESIEEMVDGSHEMAIGLCEHYDTLNRISAGDFSTRASVSSSNELIAKLGELINSSAETLVGTIEEQRRIDNELQEAYRTLQDIIEFLPDATFVIDRESRIIAWNRAMENMSGVKKEDMLGKGEKAYSVPFYGTPRAALIDYLDKTDDEIEEHYSNVHRKGETLFAENFVRLLRKGEGAFIWITASPLFDRNGVRAGAIESVRDITEQKRAAEEKTHLETQLQQAQKMEAIGQLAGGVAHDFNNILTAITGYAYLIQRKAVKDSFEERHATQILGASGKAARLIKDLLAFSRKQIINLAPVDLNEVVSGISEILQRLIGEDIDLSISMSDEPLIAMVDSGQVQQIILNLATNARDAMPDGGQLSLSIDFTYPPLSQLRRHQAAAGAYGVIRVSDTGVGMNETTREKIFEPFYTTKEVGKGTGLGLSMAFGIVVQHDGFIEVESSPGEGSTFSVFLPLMKSCEKEGISYLKSAQLEKGGDETILLAEDNNDVREVMCEVLEGAGYTVVTAVDGEKAIEAFQSLASSISLVVVDVIMPRMDGQEVYNAIKSIRSDTRFIFTSGYTAEVIHRKGILDSRFHFLRKPSLPNELLIKVREVLDEEP